MTPKLGGGISPQEWLRHAAAEDRKKRAFARAREAGMIANYISLLEAENEGLKELRNGKGIDE